MARQLIVTYTEVVTREQSFDVPDDFAPSSSSVLELLAGGGAAADASSMVAERDIDGWSFDPETPTGSSVSELFV